MRIGYPCINRRIGCRSDRKFRLASYTEERFFSTVRSNLSCLRQILEWNVMHDIRFFRISSDFIPFASHLICSFPWQKRFADELALIGSYLSESGIRISMHPDQFIILNSPDQKIVARSIDELIYHADLLDLMGLDVSAKIQLHIGGLYGDPQESTARFIRVYNHLDPAICRRLVIENDDQRFNAADCLKIYEQTGIPVLFDVFHHSCKNNGEGIREMLLKIGKTWKNKDGIMMVDYSSQHPDKRPGGHAERIDINDFKRFLEISHPFDMDIMLEIKDKEASALAAVYLAKADPRFL
ncbi:MAG: UV DNA damage repair endonuclease UvsE [Methanoregulaceae archaeon]|nr:UV DNA damage repair endonuclease UvsE [Methanoregulaceae archaeon]MCU0628810.1 UV DNA damage repair endonuclease UvsE [Methanoregulaceae archaeon]